MAIFGKKQENYEDEDLDKEVPTRAFKDLKPENKKKRREPPRPWGRGERLFISSILLTTIILSSVLALSARDWKLPGLPRLKIPEAGFDIFKGEKIVIGETGDEKAKKAIMEFKEITKKLSGVYALYVVRLPDGPSYGVNEKEIKEAASLIKLPTLAALYMEAEKGNFDLDTKYTLKNSDKRPGSGSLSGKPAGTVLTYRDLARLIGRQSDNTAFNIFRTILGDSKINEAGKAAGMTNTDIITNKTTPEDVGIFFQKLWGGKIVSAKGRDEIFDFLTDTIYENWIAAGVPEGVRVAHKYGREVHVVNDAGIVFAKEPFILVIMSEGVIESEADRVFPELAKIIYKTETSR